MRKSIIFYRITSTKHLRLYIPLEQSKHFNLTCTFVPILYFSIIFVILCKFIFNGFGSSTYLSDHSIFGLIVIGIVLPITIVVQKILMLHTRLNKFILKVIFERPISCELKTYKKEIQRI